jgi:putative oxidoreductase
MKNLLSALGRIIYALPFLAFGIMHILNASKMAGMVPAYLPYHPFWIYLTGVALVISAILIIIEKVAKFASFGIAVFLVFMIIMLHIPGLSNPAIREFSMMSLLKDAALAGAALFMSQHLKN